MHRRTEAALALGLMLVAAGACGFRKKTNGGRGTVKEATEAENDADDSSPVTATPSGASKVEKDVSYGSDPSQKLDVYLPDAPAKAPVLFIVHGGAWQIGDKAHSGFITNKVAHWVPKGYIVVSPNYRLTPPDPIQQADDVGAALAYAQAHAAQWGGDPDKFALIGHSSGAHLVSLIVSDPTIATKHQARPWLGAVVLDSAAFDVERIMSQRHFPFYDKVFKAGDTQQWRDCSPLHRLKAKPTPLLAVCSSERRMSCIQAGDFVKKVSDLGGRAQLYPVALTHKQINEELGTSGPYTEVVDSFLKTLGLP